MSRVGFPAGWLGLFAIATLWVADAGAQEGRFTIVTQTRLDPAEWQRAIDRQEYLVRLVLDRQQPGAAIGRWRGSLGGEPVEFEMLEQPVRPTLSDEGYWRASFSVPDGLDTRSGLAGAMAIVAYGLSSGGAVFVPGEPRVTSLESRMSHVDIHAALGTGKRDLAVARYPGRVRPVGAAGAIVITVHRD